MNKILFLDVDGVLTSSRAHYASNRPGMHMALFDPVTVAFLNRWFGRGTGWQIVVSSTWGKEFAQNAFDDICASAGLDLDFHALWNTPAIGHRLRGYEIEKWFEDASEQATRDAGSYIILDDTDDMTESQQLNFVRTDPEDGMLARHYYRALMLKNKIEKPLDIVG